MHNFHAYSPSDDTILVVDKWVSYAEAVETTSDKEAQYELLATLLDASREQYVPDDLKQAIHALVNKMF